MYDGKKTTAEKIIYDAIDKIKSKTKFKHMIKKQQKKVFGKINYLHKKFLKKKNFLKILLMILIKPQMNQKIQINYQKLL